MEHAQFYQQLENEKVECLLCPRSCVIESEEVGYCGIRKNKKGKLFSMVYARPNALNVDPIEKKPLYHVFPGTKILSLGTVGCNLRCKFCQNWNISCASFSTENALNLSPTRVVQLALHYEAKAIAFTYNEPTIFAEYVMDTSARSAEEGLKNVMVTNGYISEAVIPRVYEHIDAANVDLKSFDDPFYRKQTEASLKPVLNSLLKLKKMGIWLEITNLVIPGLNDDPEKIREMCDWIRENLGADTPLHFTAFHPDHELTDIPPTTPTTLLNIREMALAGGLKFVYTGNIKNEASAGTYCPNCGEMKIRRNWHRSTFHNLDPGGKCTACDFQLPGIFHQKN